MIYCKISNLTLKDSDETYIFEWLKAIKNFLIEIPVEISAFIVAPFLYFFVDKETGHLPRWLSWYDEPNYGAWETKVGNNHIFKSLRIKLGGL